MKKLVLIGILFTVSRIGFTQEIDISSLFSTSTASYYKNAKGLSLDYSKRFNKYKLSIGLHGIIKNNDFSEIGGDLSDGRGYIIREIKGKLSIIGIDLGISRIVIENDFYQISLGPFLLSNFYKFNDNIHYYDLGNGNSGDFKRDECKSNKLGIGMSFNLELKNVLLKKISIISKFKPCIVRYESHSLKNDDPFYQPIQGITNFELGISYTY
jgi:hypothetical protein